MNIKLLNLIMFMLLLLISNIAKAGLITETWQATITGSDVSGYNVDDIFEWQITFDESSMIFELYNDGADGIARTIDDEVQHVSDANCPNGNACGFLLRDANIIHETLTPLLDVIANTALNNSIYANFYDRYQSNFNNTWTENNNFNYWNVYDHIRFLATYDPLLKTGDAQLMVYLAEKEQSYISFTLGAIVNERALVTDVPEPPAIALFLLSFIGLVFTRKASN